MGTGEAPTWKGKWKFKASAVLFSCAPDFNFRLKSHLGNDK